MTTVAEIQPLTLKLAFDELEDPRRMTLNMRHKFYDILVIALSGILAGADDWKTVAEFGQQKIDWFSQFLELPAGIPSHDVFNNVFRKLDSTVFESCFMRWTKSLSKEIEGVVALDGKTLRRSHDKSTDTTAIHMVSAWSVKNQLVLGQLKVYEKSNEITAIPELLEALQLKGCLITADAMGCQKKIAEKICSHQSDYLLQVKENHPKLLDSIKKGFFDSSQEEFDLYFSHPAEICSTPKHGRQENRKCWVSQTLDFVDQREEWSALARIVVIESTRIIRGEESLEHRFYITSDRLKTAEELLCAKRNHWEIENCVHWILDVAFQEGLCRIRKDNGAENFSILRRIALNVSALSRTQLTIKALAI